MLFNEIRPEGNLPGFAGFRHGSLNNNKIRVFGNQPLSQDLNARHAGPAQGIKAPAFLGLIQEGHEALLETSQFRSLQSGLEDQGRSPSSNLLFYREGEYAAHCLRSWQVDCYMKCLSVVGLHKLRRTYNRHVLDPGVDNRKVRGPDPPSIPAVYPPPRCTRASALDMLRRSGHHGHPRHRPGTPNPRPAPLTATTDSDTGTSPWPPEPTGNL
jgi:hypothetical protein